MRHTEEQKGGWGKSVNRIQNQSVNRIQKQGVMLEIEIIDILKFWDKSTIYKAGSRKIK